MGMFKVGEVAICIGRNELPAGIEVEIIDVGPWDAECKKDPRDGAWNATRTDYLIKSSHNGLTYFISERFLRKRPQPGHTTQKFRQSLIPCDDLYRQRFLEKHAPVKELEARLKAMYTVPELPRSQRRVELQPFDHFFGGFDD